MIDDERDRMARSDAWRRQRWGYGVAGAALIAWGMRRGPVARALALALGGGLLYSTATGRSPLEAIDDLRGMRGSDGGGAGEIRVERSVTVSAQPEDVYRFWRNLENLPRFMRHLESVRKHDDRRSHWVATGPAGSRIEWEAEITRDEPGRELAWRSLPGSEVDSRGTVLFRPDPGGRGTEIDVRMSYRPPAGRLGAAVARLLGEEPQVQLEDDLNRLRRLVESGEIPSLQPGGATGLGGGAPEGLGGRLQ